MIIFLLCVCLVGISSSAVLPTPAENANQQPTADKIFGYLMTDSDWTDVLFVCDFLKSKDYDCNVTVQGVDYLKNKTVKADSAKVTTEKSRKIAVPNVRGKWSESDGLMKKSFNVVDSLDIVAKCFFRPSYFECFGVPRCDSEEPATPCQGGEPWRGTFEGAPNTGFRGHITAQAMFSQPQPIDEQPEPQPVVIDTSSSSSNSRGTNSSADKLSAPVIEQTKDESGGTKITAFMASPNKNNQVNITVWTSGNNTDGDSFVSSIVNSQSSSSSSHQSSSRNILPENFFQSLFPSSQSLFPTNFFPNSLFGGLDRKPETATRPEEALPMPQFPSLEGLFPSASTPNPNDTTAAANNSTTDPCASRQQSGMFLDFDHVRCMISSFQQRMFSSFWNSFPQVRLDIPAPVPHQPVSQPFNGFRIVMTPMRGGAEGKQADSDADEDLAMPRWFDEKK